MSLNAKSRNLIDCEREKTEQLVNSIKSMIKEIADFNTEFIIFVEDQKRLAYDLWNNVTRYNILDGVQCEYPIATKEELLEELIVKIQEQTTKIHKSLIEVKEKYEKLPKYSMILEQQSDQIDWNPVNNYAVKGTLNHKPPSEYLEEIADILYQYDIAITCMFHYFDALNIQEKESYQNLLNSFGITREFSDFVNQFKINLLTLIK